MRILGKIVQALVRAMFDAGHDLAFCGAIGPRFVGALAKVFLLLRSGGW